MPAFASLLALAFFIIAGCATDGHDVVSTETITNPQGHVIGRKDLMRDKATRAEAETLTYYTPRYDARGDVVAYEESVPDGVVIRAPNGKRTGIRYQDLRSRGTNTNSEGISINVNPERQRD